MKDEVPLKEYTDKRLEELEKAILLAKQNIDQRLESVNEFRAQLNDQAKNFITRAEHDVLVKDIQDLREFKAVVNAKASQNSVTVAYVITIISLIISISSFIMRVMGR